MYDKDIESQRGFGVRNAVKMSNALPSQGQMQFISILLLS
jgi:hypothetical protein